MTSKYSRLSISGAAVLASVLMGAAYVVASDGYTASINTPVAITGPDSMCKNVTNNSATGLSEYVPTASTAEWQSFVANPPAGVSLNSCTMTCAGGGVIVGGYCWYLGANAASCDTTCTSHGGTNLSGTRDYAGSGGTLAHCQAVINALDPTYTYAASDNNQPGTAGWGCGKVALAGGERRRYLATTDPSLTLASWQRACACGSGTPQYLGWKTDTHAEDWLVTSAYTLDPAGWTTSANTLPIALRQTQFATVGNYVYIFGGNTGTAISNVILRAPVSDPTNWTNTGATLPSVLAHGQTAVIGNYIYLFGGMITTTGTYTNVIYRAPVSDPTNWTNTGATLPVAVGQSHLAIIGSYVYLFGGWNGTSGSLNIILRAPVSDPTSWTNTGATLPGNLNGGQVAVIGDYVYLFGGFNGLSAVKVIYRAPISDPTAWTNTGATIPVNLNGATLVVAGDRLYILGGTTGGTTYVNTIYSAPITGPTVWSNTGALLPAKSMSAPIAVINGVAYIFGGYNGTAVTSAIYRAPLTAQ